MCDSTAYGNADMIIFRHYCQKGNIAYILHHYEYLYIHNIIQDLCYDDTTEPFRLTFHILSTWKLLLYHANVGRPKT